MYDELLREKRKQSVGDAVRSATLSGGVSGGVLGGLSGVVSGARSKAALLKAAILGAGLSGGVAGGTTYVGSELMGAPDEDDPTAFTRRGAVGGAVGGGAIGAALGALAARGKVKIPGSPNMISEYFAKLGHLPLRESLKRGGLAGGLAGGATAGYLGADEGMQVDAMNQELLRRRRAKLEEALA